MGDCNCMNIIKNSLLFLCSLVVSFGILMVGDWRIVPSTSAPRLELNPEYAEAKKIVLKRMEEEDLPLKIAAINSGFKPLFHPKLSEEIFGSNVPYPLIAGLPYTNTFLCNEDYGLIKYKSDRFGFRNNDRDWDVKNPRLVIGDSAVHGECVNFDKTLPSLLSKKTNSTVLNLGISGNYPSHYLTYGELFIPKLKPTHVYVVFHSNDNRLIRASMLEKFYVHDEKQLFATDKLALFDTNFFIEQGSNAIRELRKAKENPEYQITKSFVFKLKNAFLRHITLPNIRKIIMPDLTNFSKTKEVISYLNNLCIAHRCVLTIVFDPNSNYWAPDSGADDYGDAIRVFASDLNLNFVDLRKILDRSRDSEDYARKGPHHSPKGYEKIANFITSIVDN